MHRAIYYAGLTPFWRHWSTLLLIITVISGSAFSSPALAVSDTDKDWDQLEKNGVTALDSNEYWKAEPMLKQAVIKAGKFGDSDIRLAKSLGELGRLYAVRGRFTEAEPYLEEELCVREKALGRWNGMIIAPMGKMIRFYLLHGSISKADPMTEDILAFVEGKLREPLQQKSATMKMQKGQPLQGWAGQADPIMVDPLLEWAITCDDLGGLYRVQGNYPMADRLFKAALDLKATILGKQHLSLANSYDSLAEICVSKNEMGDAESYFNDALGVTEKVLSSHDPAVCSRLEKLARCYIKEGKYQQAEEAYQRALQLLGSEPSTNGPRARFLLALGCLYDDQRNFGAAAPVLQQALELAERNSGPLSFDLVPYLRKYAYTVYYLGRKSETEQLRARVSSIIGDSDLERKPEIEQPLRAQAKSLAPPE